VPRHDCRGCGACCASFRIGPLLPSDLQRLEAAAPAVAAVLPRPIEDGWIDVEDGGSFLRKAGGTCVFFDDGCTVHRVAGAEAKPLVCRLYPLQLVQTEAGVRLGNRATCLSDAAVWQTGGPPDGAVIGSVLADGGPTPRDEAPGEAALLRVLQLPEADDSMVLAFLAQRPDPTDVPALGAWIDGTLDALLEEIDAIVADGASHGIALGPTHPNSPTGRELAALRAWRAERSGTPQERWPVVPRDGVPWLVDALRRQVFLRQYAIYPSLAWALLAWLLAARVAAAFASSRPGGFTVEGFGRHWSSWAMLLEGPRLQRTLVTRPPPFD
jgi:Fe-S-cluster containining protein